MSELFEQFAGLPEFLDIRQDQYADVMRAIHRLNTLYTEDPDEVIRIIGEMELSRVHRTYQSKCNEIRQGNSGLERQIHNASFRPFKSVVGDNDYV